MTRGVSDGITGTAADVRSMRAGGRAPDVPVRGAPARSARLRRDVGPTDRSHPPQLPGSARRPGHSQGSRAAPGRRTYPPLSAFRSPGIPSLPSANFFVHTNVHTAGQPGPLTTSTRSDHSCRRQRRPRRGGRRVGRRALKASRPSGAGLGSQSRRTLKSSHNFDSESSLVAEVTLIMPYELPCQSPQDREFLEPRPTRRVPVAGEATGARPRGVVATPPPGGCLAPQNPGGSGVAVSRLPHLDGRHARVPANPQRRAHWTATPGFRHSLQRAQPARRPRPAISDRGRLVSIGSQCPRVESPLFRVPTPWVVMRWIRFASQVGRLRDDPRVLRRPLGALRFRRRSCRLRATRTASRRGDSSPTRRMGQCLIRLVSAGAPSLCSGCSQMPVSRPAPGNRNPDGGQSVLMGDEGSPPTDADRD